MARQTTPYVYGSAATRWEAQPYQGDEYERRRQRQQRPRPQVRPKQKAKIDRVAVLLTCLTFLAVMTAGIIYLRLQFQSTYLNKSVVNLQSEKIGDGIYGKSITDPCLGWEDSKQLIYDLAEMNANA